MRPPTCHCGVQWPCSVPRPRPRETHGFYPLQQKKLQGGWSERPLGRPVLQAGEAPGAAPCSTSVPQAGRVWGPARLLGLQRLCWLHCLGPQGKGRGRASPLHGGLAVQLVLVDAVRGALGQRLPEALEEALPLLQGQLQVLLRGEAASHCSPRGTQRRPGVRPGRPLPSLLPRPTPPGRRAGRAHACWHRVGLQVPRHQGRWRVTGNRALPSPPGRLAVRGPRLG